MNKKSWITIAIEAIVFILLLGTISKCSSDKIDLLEHNIDSYKSKLELVETENGELLAAKQSLILSESQAREELGITKEEMKSLKKTLDAKVAQISKLESQIALPDTVYMKGDTVYVDKKDNTLKKFSWSDNWLSLNANVFGKSIKDSELSITNMKMNLPIEFGVADNYKVFIKTPNPYVQFTDISTATIYGSSVAPKPKRFHHGIYVGLGVNYGFIHRQFDLGASFGYGLMYSF